MNSKVDKIERLIDEALSGLVEIPDPFSEDPVDPDDESLPYEMSECFLCLSTEEYLHPDIGACKACVAELREGATAGPGQGSLFPAANPIPEVGESEPFPVRRVIAGRESTHSGDTVFDFPLPEQSFVGTGARVAARTAFQYRVFVGAHLCFLQHATSVWTLGSSAGSYIPTAVAVHNITRVGSGSRVEIMATVEETGLEIEVVLVPQEGESVVEMSLTRIRGVAAKVTVR